MSRWFTAASPIAPSRTSTRSGPAARRDQPPRRSLRGGAGPASSSEQQAEKSGLPAANPVALAQIRRVEGLISAFLSDEAASERVLLPEPELLEAHFDDEDGTRPALELDGCRLHGSIDRVDVADTPNGRVGLVNDYKLSREVTKGADLEDDGKLQLQLYALALRKLWGIEPVGGVYHPTARHHRERPASTRLPQQGRARRPGRLWRSSATTGWRAKSSRRHSSERLPAARRSLARSPKGGSVAIPRAASARPSATRRPICRKERGMGDTEETEEEDEER